MLDSLREFSTVEAIGVLSSVGSMFTPDDPLKSYEADIEQISFQNENVLTEIRRRLSIDPRDNANEARDKILFFISDQLSQIALRGADERAIKARLGDKNLLRPDLYTFDFGDYFGFLKGRGVREPHILDAFNYPDEVENFTLPSPLAEEGTVAMFVKHHRRDDPQRCFTFLVVAQRKGDALKLMDAIRIYPSDVDISTAVQPFDYLQAFVNVYGLDIILGGTDRRKIFFLTQKERVIHLPQNKALEVVETTPPGLSHGPMVYRVTEQTYDIGLVYAINDDMYRRDLRRHNVQVVI